MYGKLLKHRQSFWITLYLQNWNCTVVHNVCTLSSTIKLDTICKYVNIYIQIWKQLYDYLLQTDKYMNKKRELIQIPYFLAHKTHIFPPEKCGLNSTCVLHAEGKCYFQTYKYPYICYTSLSWDSTNNHEDDFSGSDDNFLGFYDE